MPGRSLLHSSAATPPSTIGISTDWPLRLSVTVTLSAMTTRPPVGSTRGLPVVRASLPPTRRFMPHDILRWHQAASISRASTAFSQRGHGLRPAPGGYGGRSPRAHERMTERSLQRLYEDPATPLSSGSERARLQATMLAAIASAASRPLLVVDVGCGDGSATAVAAAVCRQTPGADV